MFMIYSLEDPRNNKVYYVGMTDDLHRRLFQHIRCDGNNDSKNEWIWELESQGHVPIMRTLEKTHNRTHAYNREGYWIEHYKQLAMPLTNRPNEFAIKRGDENLSLKLTAQALRYVGRGITSGKTLAFLMEDEQSLTDYKLSSSLISQALLDSKEHLITGMTPAQVVKTFNLPYGRATQELSATVNMVDELIKQGRM